MYHIVPNVPYVPYVPMCYKPEAIRRSNDGINYSPSSQCVSYLSNELLHKAWTNLNFSQSFLKIEPSRSIESNVTSSFSTATPMICLNFMKF